MGGRLFFCSVLMSSIFLNAVRIYPNLGQVKLFSFPPRAIFLVNNLKKSPPNIAYVSCRDFFDSLHSAG